MTELKTKQELLAALKDARERVSAWFEAIPASDFFTRQADAWSASDNMDHLIRAHKPIVTAFKMPRLALQGMFGKSDKASMSYETLCGVYLDAIKKGAVASGNYLPEQQEPKDAEAQKQAILQDWASASGALIAQAEKWREEELDQYQLPHPILGKLTIREMLFFTIYHNLRHARQEGD